MKLCFPEPRVCIIILNWNGWQDTIACIESIKNLDYENYQVLVIDNGSTDDSVRQIRVSFPKLDIIQTGRNLGYSKANNIGIKHALKENVDYILLLNNDAEVTPDFLTVLIDAAVDFPDSGMLGPKIYDFKEPDKVCFAGAHFDYGNCRLTTTGFSRTNQKKDLTPFETDYVNGCALLVKRKTIEKIGMLDERFFLYWEDVDWGLRCMKAGLKNLVVPASQIWHKDSGSNNNSISLLRIYHNLRSRILMARLHNSKVLCKLKRGVFREIAWLLFKSSDPYRIKKARIYFAVIIDYHSGKTGRGPHWLWTKT